MRRGAGLRCQPVDDAFPVQVLQAAADLGRVEDGPPLVEAGLAHVVDVKLQVASVHERQHQAQGVLRLVGVRQAHLEEGWSGDSTAEATVPPPHPGSRLSPRICC